MSGLRAVPLLVLVGACGSSSGAAPAADAGALIDEASAPGPDLGVASDLPRPQGDVAVPLEPDAAVDVGMTSTPDLSTACSACTSYGAPELVGQVQDPQLDALSGIAASWRNAGVLFVHNDRDRPEFFAVAESGAVLGRFTVTGGAVRDVEDIAVGRCPTGSCVHLADLGNNISPRTEFSILRVTEPLVPAGMTATATLAAERLAFSYPDGPHNAESLMIDPMTGALYVITKVAAGQHSVVYELPPFGAGGVATKVADLPVPAAGDQPTTAADAHPCGAGFLLRTNNTAYEFRIPVGTAFEAAFKVTPVSVPVGSEVQSEGISYRPDGRGYYTNSEGARPPIHRVLCR
jgi:hypothetical protein